ncbi:hypothetical protein O9G_001560 [Rozella allomycis CSF55]|uniref:N-alpha-acetyltransferase 40 n=1 Tax=Rozella allomycis (strain CSF55) TaxID=988480 RepID=A0A075B4Y6_ROZAC|nr:hypothetical protein O9G_001560 [Rozella allomycis CSF55]|eukprot:EPZ36576.1 hypothetical protein O9G_001560 [Rozella allomycis CSF55]
MIRIEFSDNPNEELKSWMINLIEENARGDYETSEEGWDRDKKLREISHPEAKYLYVYHSDNAILPIGFSHYRIEDEERLKGGTRKVLYIYEIHFMAQYTGKGFGSTLMENLEQLGSQNGVSDLMLTVFKRNNYALSFYKKRGFIKDELSPEDKSYMILSKPMRRRRIKYI